MCLFSSHSRYGIIFCTMPLKSVFSNENTLSVETFMNAPLSKKLTKYPVICRPVTEMYEEGSTSYIKMTFLDKRNLQYFANTVFVFLHLSNEKHGVITSASLSFLLH